MPFEYSVVPAPKKGQKAKGVKTAEDRFAHALQAVMNAKGADGWEYVRTDTLPAEERHGLTGTKTVYQNMMVFQRALAVPVEEPTALLEAPKEEVLEEVAADDIPALPPFSARRDRDVVEAEVDADADPLVADPKQRID